MVTVKIHGMNISGCTQRVVAVCNEIGLNYELVVIDLMSGAQKQPEYVDTMHPFGQVPVLEDEDGTKIFECRAISRYLVAKYGKDSGLLPSSADNLKAYGLFEQAASIEYSSFDPPVVGLVRERMFARVLGREPDEAVATKHEDTIKAKLEGYERILSKQRYLAGDHITLADLFHLASGTMANRVSPGIMESKPSVKRWWEDITARESWKKVQRDLLQN